MKIIFFINCIISLVIFLFSSFSFFIHYSKSKIFKAINYLAIIGLLYLIISIFSFLWFFDFLEYTSADFVFIYSMVIFIQTLFLCIFVYLFSRKKNVFYLLFFYLIVLMPIFYPVLNYSDFFLIVSFLLSLLLFLSLASRRDIYRNVGYFGIFYSIISFIFQILYIFGKAKLFVLSLFSNLVFLFLIVVFLMDLKKYPKRLEIHYGGRSYFFRIFRDFVFIIVLVNFIFIGTLGIHEFGHFSTSQFYDCSYRSIVYEGGLPHTEVLCGNLTKDNFVLLGGVLLPFILGILLFIIGGVFLKDIALLFVGFNLIISSDDIFKLGFSENLVIASTLLGSLCLIIGLAMLIKSKTEEYVESIF